MLETGTTTNTEASTNKYSIDDYRFKVRARDKAGNFGSYGITTFTYELENTIQGYVENYDRGFGVYVEGATVNMYDSSGNKVDSAITNSEGHYRIPLPQPGDYILKASYHNRELHYPQTVSVTDTSHSYHRHLELKYDDRDGSITGQIGYFINDPYAWIPQEGVTVETPHNRFETTTDSNGSFTLPIRLDPSQYDTKYSLRFQKDGHISRDKEVTISSYTSTLDLGIIPPLEKGSGGCPYAKD